MHWQDIPVTIRRNHRAKQIYLRIRPTQGVEVVLPYRVSVRDVPGILERNNTWIQERIATLRNRGEGPGQGLCPQQIVLVLSGCTYHVSYARTDHAFWAEQDSMLHLGTVESNDGVRLLQNWLVHKGKAVLLPMCLAEGQRLGIPIGRIQIRNQHSCWGSCSRSGTISLNAKLMFLEKELARHVMRHELCHVLHRNHGSTFWSALRQLDLQTDQYERELKQAWVNIPAWSKWRQDK